MKKHSIVVFAVVICTLVIATVTMAADDPFTGTWKLDVSKSKYNPGPTYLKSSIFKVGAQSNGQKCIYDEVYVDGKSTHGEYAVKYDGKDYPVTGDSHVNAISARRIDPNTLDCLWKKDGKVVMSERAVISKNGKTWTDTLKGKDLKGHAFTTVHVYDKQLTPATLAVDPFVGTWKLNVENSTFSPGPVPKSDILKIGTQDSALKLMGNGVDAEGKSGHYELSLIFDEKDYPSAERVNDNETPLIRI